MHYAVIMALSKGKTLTKAQSQEEAQKFTTENLTMKGNRLAAFKTTWHKIDNLVMSQILQKCGTPVLYSLTPKGLALAEKCNITDNQANATLYRKIPQVHRMYFDENKVLRKILGNGNCLYGCASFFLHDFEDNDETANERGRGGGKPPI